MSIIECPSCQAQFRAPPLNPLQRVRCSACGHIWPYEPPVEENLEDSPPPLVQPDAVVDEGAASVPPVTDSPPQEEDAAPTANPDTPPGFAGDGAPLPRLFARPREGAARAPVFTPVRARALGAVAATILVCLLILGGLRPLVTAIAPRLQASYDLLGVHAPLPIPPVAFKDVRAKAEGDSLDISGVLVNQTEDQRNLEPIQVTLYGPDGKELSQKGAPPIVFRLDARFVGPSETVAFNIKRTIERAGDLSAIDLRFIPAQ